MSKKYNPTIHRKVAYMQRIADYIGHGYTRYTDGRVLITKAAKLAERFARIYRVDLDVFERARGKKLGLGNAVLLMHQPGDSPELYWILLVSPGDHPAEVMEKLKDCRAAPIELTGYELVRQTKAAPERAAGSVKSLGKTVWTWRMTNARYEGLREVFISLIRQKQISAFYAELADLFKSPGFSGIRSQVGHLWALIGAEWKRRIGLDAELPKKPFLFYTRRIAESQVKLSHIVKLAAQSIPIHEKEPEQGQTSP